MRIRNESDLDAYDALSKDSKEQRKTYHEVMSSDDRKRMEELRVFLEFVKASGLPIDPSTALCLDPPFPDIRCRLGSSLYFFELAEVTDEGLARSYGESLKTRKSLGGFYSEVEPLTSIFTSKAQKTYQTDGVPLDLLLYYWKQASFDPDDQKVLSELKLSVDQMLLSGPFMPANKHRTGGHLGDGAVFPPTLVRPAMREVRVDLAVLPALPLGAWRT